MTPQQKAKELVEGNKLIAEFMGYEYFNDHKLNGIKGVLKKEGKLSLHANIIDKSFCTKYHSSWDWLMPVVEKIEHNITPVEILDTQCRIGRTIYNKEEILVSSDESKIESVWQAVVQFIQWYNLNPHP